MEVTSPLISDNVDTFIGPESNKTSDTDTNNLVIPNTAEFQDPLELSLEIEATYGLKPCFVELERCDKIWETIQLIRDLQEDPNEETSDDDNGSEMTDDYDNYDNDTVHNDDAETINGKEDNNNSNPIDDDEPSSSHNDTESCSSIQNNPTAPYIKYQPVLGNGNTALPNFQFSVQRTRVLYPCVTCGKQYNHIRSLREHEERIHNIIQPPARKKSDHSNNKNNNETSSLNNQENEVVNKNKPIEIVPVKNTRSDDKVIVDSTEFIKSVMASEPGTKITCCYCDKIYVDKYNLKKHVVVVHGGDPELIRSYKRKLPQPSLPEPEPIVEKKCEEEPPQKKRRVERSRNLNVYRCETCGKHYYSQKNMRVHSRKVHGIYVRLPTSKKDIKKHVGNNSNTDKINNEKNKVQTTLSISSNSLTYKSPTKNKNSLENKNSENSTLRTCPICDMKTIKLSVFRSHCKTHGVTIKFQNLYPREQDKTELDCKVCGETFISFNHVVEHYWNIHQQRLRYKCYICGALSDESENLVEHLLKTHKIYFLLRKPTHNFKCHVCLRNFTSKSVYRMHVTQGHGLDLKTKQVEEVLQSSGRINDDPSPPPPPPLPPPLPQQPGRKLATTRGLKRPAQIKRQVKVKRPRPPSSRNGLREKTKLDYDENVLSLNSIVNSSNSSTDDVPVATKRTRRSSTLSNDKNNTSISSDAPTELNTPEPTYCILCSKNGFKNIRKHFLEYHKVRNPDSLIEQCLKMTPASSEPAVKAEKVVKKDIKVEKKKEIVSPVKKAETKRRSNTEANKVVDTEIKQVSVPTGGPIPGPTRTFVAIKNKDGSNRYICKYCPFEAGNYDKMRRDEYGHRVQLNGADGDKIKPSNPTYLNLDPELILKSKFSRKSEVALLTDDKDSSIRRSSFSVEKYQENNHLTQGNIKQCQEQIEHRCSNCSRLFRNGDILASHKISCNMRTDHQQITNDTSDTRESSDRDSGIGISITIKKKNDSYEIVSRDNSDDSKSQDSEIPQNDLLLSDTSSDICLNGTISNHENSDEITETTSNNNVLQFSETYEEIKIQKVDNDEDIIVDADDQNTTQMTSPVDIKPQVSKRKNSINCKSRKISSLVTLCTHVLDKIHANESCTRKCYVCWTDWPSAISRASHMTGIHKSGRR